MGQHQQRLVALTKIPLARSCYQRNVAQVPEMRLINRYFETDPTDQEDQASLLSRPSLRRWITGLGDGPIRAVYSQPGTFDEALFVVSGYEVYRVDRDESTALIGTLDSTTLDSFVSMAATDDPYLFMCDGGTLWVYSDDGFAIGTLTSTGAIANNDTILIGTVYYKWTSGSVDAGTPAGNVGNPWLVALGASVTEALANMRSAINATGTAGTTYSTVLIKHTTVEATSSSATTLKVRAITAGTGGNAIATTDPVGANIAWGGATLAGGGTDSFTPVVTPDDVGIVSVGYIASFVICVVTPGEGFNGRFYWIEPFENTIDPLNFATAERAPDPCWSVRVAGGQFWLPGTNTNEVWYPTGNELAPFLSLQSRVFDRGVWEGSDVRVKDSVILVDQDGVVYAIGDRPTRISTHGIEERIRRAMNVQIQAEL